MLLSVFCHADSFHNLFAKNNIVDYVFYYNHCIILTGDFFNLFLSTTALLTLTDFVFYMYRYYIWRYSNQEG